MLRRILARLRPDGAVRLLLMLCVGLVIASATGCYASGSAGTPEAKALVEKGLSAYDTGKYDDAIQQYELALKQDPMYCMAMAHLAMAYHRRGFSDRAIQECKEALECNRDLAEPWDNLGEIYTDLGRYKDAEAAYLEAIKTLPNVDDATFQPHFNYGRLLQILRRDDEALQQYLAAIANNAKLVEAHVAAGLLYLKNNVDKDASDHFKLAHEYDPMNPIANFGLGKINRKKEQWEDAIRHYRAGLRLRPDHPGAKPELEECYAKAPPRVAKTLVTEGQKLLDDGKPADALEALEPASRIDPKLVDPWVLMARAHMDLKPRTAESIQKAETAGKKAFSMEPRNKDARLIYAVTLMVQGKYQPAEELLRGLRRDDPKSVKVRTYLGVTFYKQRKYRRAEREWLEALKHDPENKQIQKNLDELLKTPGIKKANELNDAGVKALAKGDLQEAMDLLKGAIELDDQFAVAYSNLALLYIQLDDLKTAREKAKASIERDPDLARAHNNLGTIESREGHLVEAKAAFEEAAKNDANDPDPHFNIALILLEQKKVEAAEQELELAISISPKHAPSHHRLALIYLSRGLVDKAETRLKLAIRENAGFIPAYLDLARLFLKQKRYDEAKKILEGANQIDPASPDPWVGFAEAQQALGETAEAQGALLEAATRYRAMGKYREMVDVCRRAVALDDKNAKAHGDLGVALMNVGSYTESLAELARADALDAKNLIHRFNMGICYTKKGDRRRAVEAYRELLREQPENYFILENLSDLYLEGEDPALVSRREAIEMLEKALRLDPDPKKKDLIRDALKRLKGGS